MNNYTVILNSFNRMDLTTSPNDATYNFDWGELKEGQYKLTWGFTKTLNTTPFLTLLTTKTPWARYSAETWNSGTNILPDLTTNGRNATTTGITSGTSLGNGSTATITYLAGVIGSIIQFPAGSIPNTFTICFLTRYTGTNMARILTSNNGALYGHWTGSRGVLFSGGWKTATGNVGTQQNWLNMVATNNGAIGIPNNILVDGVGVGTGTGAGGNSQLGIGGIGSSEPSDFRFSQMIIFDQGLTQAEMVIVSTALNTYLTTGVLR